MKDNQKISVEKRTMPGYVLVNMDLNEDSWQVVKGTPGVTGFVGASNEPIPLTQAEVDRLLHREVAQKVPSRAQFSIGESVKVISGRSPTSQVRSPRSTRTRPAQGAGIHLRPRDPRRGRVRPGEEDLDMAKKVLTNQAAGARRPGLAGASRRPALGQHGINIMEFVKAFNAQTSGDMGVTIPVVITVYEDRSFTFITKTPPAAVLIRQAIGIDKGSASRTAPRSARSPTSRFGRSPRRSSATSTRTTSTRRPTSSRAPPARWAWRSSRNGEARQDLRRGQGQGRSLRASTPRMRPSSS